MAARIPWDKYETAILIEACVDYNNNRITKKAAIRRVSNELRQKAIDEGKIIDDIYRNENGISMQFEIINSLIRHTGCGLHNASKLFADMVRKYLDNRDEYEKILKEARNMDTTNEKKMQEQFSQWLPKQLSPAQMSEIYVTYYDMDEYLQKEKILSSPILETYDVSKIKNIEEMIDKNGAFRYIHRAKIDKYSKAINLYLAWLNNKYNSDELEKQELYQANSMQDELEIKYVEFGKNSNLAFSKVEYFEYFGEREDDIGSWKRLYQKVLTYIYEDYPDKIKQLVGKCIGAGTRVDIAESEDDMIAPRKFADNLYVETNLNASNIIDKIRHLLDYCMIDYENLVVAYVSKKENCKEEVAIEKSHDDSKDTNVVITSEYKNEVENQNDTIVSNRKKFSQWLNDNGNPQGIILVTLMDMSKINKILLSNNIMNKDIYLIDNVSALKMILGRLQRTDMFLALDIRLQKQYRNTFEEYMQYKAQRSVADGNHGNDRKETDDEWNVWEFLNQHNLKYVDLVNKTGYLWVMGGKELNSLMIECWRHGVSFRFNEKGGTATNWAPAWKVRLEVNETLSSEKIRKAEVSIIPEEQSQTELTGIDSRLLDILTNDFENGYRINSAIDRGRMRNFYSSRYDDELLLTDEELVTSLKKVGTIRDERIFARQNEKQKDLLNDIYNDVLQVFDRGASCTYIESIYQRYSMELIDVLQIYDWEILGEQLIKISKGSLRKKQSFLCLVNRQANLEKDVISVLKSSPVPITYAELGEKMWYVPLEKIKHILVITKEIVQVAPETYFYAYNFPVNQEEITEIQKVLHSALMGKSHITDVEMRDMINEKCPGVAINTEEYTTYGFRNCLGCILKNSFSFNGPIISELGKEISTADVYAEYCEEREKVTLDDLKKISSDMNTSIIYWESVREKTIRLSEDVFVRNDQVSFDIVRTDNVLDMICEGNYIPLKDVGLFMHFPSIGVTWNGYVLESYLYSFSQKYKLVHASFSASGYFGAMVKKDSNIEDYQMLITDVLAHSSQWDDKTTALELLVDLGYQQRKKYANIEKVIHEARIIRDKLANK